MFRKRMMCDPSMYPNQQITFLDQDMIIPLSNSYSRFKGGRNDFKFRDYFVI